MLKKCTCGKEFTLKWSAQRYCSAKCSIAAQRNSVKKYRAKKETIINQQNNENPYNRR